MIDFQKVGKRIAQLRKAQNMTQDDLANCLYVSRQALSKWELGMSAPSIDSLIMMSTLFKVTIEDLLCLNDISKIERTTPLFPTQDRSFIVSQIISGELQIDIPSMFYQFSDNERMLILRAIKEKKIPCNLKDLKPRLTISEQKFLFNNTYGGITL